MAAVLPTGERLYLQPIINGRMVPGILPVTIENNGVRVAARDLEGIGVSGRIGTPDGDGYRLLTASGPVSCSIDNAAQTVSLVLPVEDLSVNVSRVGGGKRPPIVARSATGSYVNYDLAATTPISVEPGEDAYTVAGSINSVMFSPWGEVLSDIGVNAPRLPGSDEPALARLSTTYEFDEPDKPMTVRVGDVITSPPGWARGNFMGGAQVTTNYALQPTTITFPTPQIGGTLADPSAISLLVNNTQAYQNNMSSGPFSIVGVPVVTGLNEITVVTRNANGQTTSSTVPFYASSTMLRDGLTTYAASLGYLRQNYGTLQDGYRIPAFDGTLSHGLTDNDTVTVHGEASEDVQLLGLGLETTNRLGDIVLAISGSKHQSEAGALVSARYTRAGRALDVSVGGTYSVSGYYDLAAENGTPYPKASWYASAGLKLPYRLGGINFAYTEQSPNYAVGQSAGVPPSSTSFELSGSRFFLFSYTRQFWQGWSLSASAFLGDVTSSTGTVASNGLTLAISVPLGGTRRGDVSLSAGSQQIPEWGESLSAFPTSTTGFGGAVQNQTGDYVSRTATIQANTLATDLSAQISQFNGSEAAQLRADGSIAVMDGLHFSAPIDSAFAVLDVGYPNIPVYVENRPVGETGSDGRAFLPRLLPYYPNTVSVDPDALPLSASFQTSVLHVVPPLYGGVVAKLPTNPVTNVLIRVTKPRGGHPPAGSLIYLRGKDVPTVIGFEGEAMLVEPPPQLDGVVVYPGGRCRLSARLTVSLHNYLVGVEVPCVPFH